MTAVLGIDPGTRKCGFAVTSGVGATPLAIGIEPTPTILARVRALVTAHGVEAIALGGGTSADVLGGLLRAEGLTYALVDERETTLRARARYFADHPPRGWKRLVPRGMLLPPRPIDDYAALLIAERYLGGAPPAR